MGMYRTYPMIQEANADILEKLNKEGVIEKYDAKGQPHHPPYKLLGGSPGGLRTISVVVHCFRI